MTQLFALIKKELRLYFNSPIAYIFLVAFLGISSWFFFRNFFIIGQAEIRSFFSLMPWIFLFLIPALTMRLWSEEIKTGTIETLLTSSVTLWQAVLSKFIASTIFLAIALTLTLSIPFSISFIGALDWGVIFTAYLGAMLLGMAYIALGLFISALTNNQIVAFILSVLGVFAFYILGEGIVTFVIPLFLVPLFEFLGLGAHYSSIIRGVIDLKDLIFYFSFILVFLLLNVESLKQAKGRVLRSLTMFIGLAVLIVVNVVAYNTSTRFDFTEGGIYTLSESTKSIVSNLDTDLEVRVFVSEKLPPQVVGIKQQLEDYLSEYAALSGGNLKLNYVDPAKDTEQVNMAQMLGIPELQLQVIEKDQQQVMKAYLGLAVLKAKVKDEGDSFEDKLPVSSPLKDFEKWEVIPVIQDFTSFEYDFTAAIKKAASTEEKTIGFLKGHGEHELAPDTQSQQYGVKPTEEQDYALQDVLKKNYRVQIIESKDDNLDLTGINTLVIAGPKESLQDFEVTAIQDFIAAGNNAVFLIDQIAVDQMQASKINENFSNLLSYWGISVQQALIEDASFAKAAFRQGFFTYQLPYPYWLKSQNLNEDNSITANLESVVLPWASPLQIQETEGVSAETLISSSAHYTVLPATKLVEVPVDPAAEVKEGETPEMKEELQNQNFDLNPQQEFNIPNIFKPSVPMAVVAQKEGEGKILVVGDSDFVSESFTQQFAGNTSFFMNALDAFTLGDELISIRSKTVTDRPLEQVSESIKNTIRWGNIIILPFLVVIIGLVRRAIRKAKRA